MEKSKMNRDGMSCSCVLGDDAIVARWCAAHARTYRKAIADERERCEKVAIDADEIQRLRRTMVLAAEIIDRNLMHQREKVADASTLLKQALAKQEG